MYLFEVSLTKKQQQKIGERKKIEERKKEERQAKAYLYIDFSIPDGELILNFDR